MFCFSIITCWARMGFIKNRWKQNQHILPGAPVEKQDETFKPALKLAFFCFVLRLLTTKSQCPIVLISGNSSHPFYFSTFRP